MLSYYKCFCTVLSTVHGWWIFQIKFTLCTEAVSNSLTVKNSCAKWRKKRKKGKFKTFSSSKQKTICKRSTTKIRNEETQRRHRNIFAIFLSFSLAHTNRIKIRMWTATLKMKQSQCQKSKHNFWLIACVWDTTKQVQKNVTKHINCNEIRIENLYPHFVRSTSRRKLESTFLRHILHR